MCRPVFVTVFELFNIEARESTRSAQFFNYLESCRIELTGKCVAYKMRVSFSAVFPRNMCWFR
jgi:hypothetical protein